MHKRSTMPETTRLITAEEFESLQEDDYRYELVEGRIIRMNPPGSRHGHIALNIGVLLATHVKKLGLGKVVVESGYTLARNPDTVRGPDVSFIRRDRISPIGLPRGFWEGAPDLSVEVISPDNRGPALRKKLTQYLDRGTMVVLVVHPDKKTVTVHRRLASPLTLSETDELDLDDVVSGFRCQVREIFE